MESTLFVFYLVVLIFSVILHEVAHGYVAEKLGDPTARLAGRLTLNPLPHLSLFGTFIFPLITFLAMGFPVGAAKPVPYNPNNLRNPHKGGALIAVSGPLTNLLIAAVFGVFVRILSNLEVGVGESLIQMFGVIIALNLLLAVFNLLPIPPLDGSKVLNYFLPGMSRVRWEAFWYRVAAFVRQYWLVLFILFIFDRYIGFFSAIFGFIFLVIQPIINTLHIILTGFPSPFF